MGGLCKNSTTHEIRSILPDPLSTTYGLGVPKSASQLSFTVQNVGAPLISAEFKFWWRFGKDEGYVEIPNSAIADLAGEADQTVTQEVNVGSAESIYVQLVAVSVTGGVDPYILSKTAFY